MTTPNTPTNQDGRRAVEKIAENIARSHVQGEINLKALQWEIKTALSTERTLTDEARNEQIRAMTGWAESIKLNDEADIIIKKLEAFEAQDKKEISSLKAKVKKSDREFKVLAFESKNMIASLREENERLKDCHIYTAQICEKAERILSESKAESYELEFIAKTSGISIRKHGEEKAALISERQELQSELMAMREALKKPCICERLKSGDEGEGHYEECFQFKALSSPTSKHAKRFEKIMRVVEAAKARQKFYLNNPNWNSKLDNRGELEAILSEEIEAFKDLGDEDGTR